MMKRQRAVLAAVLVLFCLGLVNCAQYSQISPIDRALIFNDQSEALEITYKNHWAVASDSERAWLKKHVAPAVDRMRAAVAQYTRLALLGENNEAARVNIIQAYREATIYLTREVLE
jgi:hypothetical protein